VEAVLHEQTTARAYENVAGNHYNKYGTKNPIARRLMSGFLAAFDELTAQTGARSVFEVGCGEGHLSLRLLSSGLTVRGCDLEDSVVAEANSAAEAAGYGRPFEVRSIYDLTPEVAASELVVCCEVLEHLPDFDLALDRLVSLANPYLLVSVPREPIWRILNMARGKYLSELGNTPGHIQHWSSEQFLRGIARRCEIVAVRRPLPWTMALCRTVK
jgi:2-polyprenyl-3-methyl-5-hydroxy-6-metoxy-1,4-benzoquinol methylase